MIKYIISIFTVFALVFSMASCSNNSTVESHEDSQIKNATQIQGDAQEENQTEAHETQSTDSYDGQASKDTDTTIEETEEYAHVYSSSDSMVAPYETFEELWDNSPSIFTGECISSEPIYQNETLYTLSQVKIETVYKGDFSEGDVVCFVEMGGRSTVGIYQKECNLESKAFEPKAEPLSSDTKIAVGIEGYFPMREGEHLLLLASDTSGFLKEGPQELLSVMRTYEGKFILREDGSYKRPAASKEDKLYFDENSMVITLDEWAKTFQEKEADSDEILAKVNDINIYRSTVERSKLQYDAEEDTSKSSYTDKDWIQDQIEIEILVMEANRLGIEFSDERIQKAVNSGEEIYYNETENEDLADFIAQIDAFCKEKNITAEEYFDNYAFDVYRKNYNLVVAIRYIEELNEDEYTDRSDIDKYVNDLIEKGIYEVEYYN
jgi:hypothetical protein